MNTKEKSFSFVFLCIFFFISISLYISKEQNIYFWDFNGYWRMWENIYSTFITSHQKVILIVLKSIDFDDYNYLPVALTSVFKALPLPSRTSYIVSLFYLYYIPLVFILFYFIKAITDLTGMYGKLVILLLISTYVPFWAPTLRGYPDLCGLVFIVFSVFLTIRKDFTSGLNIKYAVLLGLCLWAPFVMRRWYAYTIVSLYLTLPLLNYFVFNGIKLELKKTSYLVVNFTLSGLSSLLPALFFQQHLLWRVLSTDYSQIYSYYQSGFYSSVETLINNNGLIFIALAIGAFIFQIFQRNRLVIIISTFSWCNLILSFIMFTRTQSPMIHHLLPYALWLLLPTTLTIATLLNRYSSKTTFSIGAGCVALSCFSFYNSFFSSTLDKNVFNLLPQKTLPLRVDNYENYLALVNDLKIKTNGNGKVLILSSTGEYNEDMLNTISNKSLTKYIAYTSQIDLRDKLNLSALMAQYYAITTPVKYVPGKLVVSIPSKLVDSKEGIGNAFTIDSDKYVLTNKTSAIVYKKVRPFTSNEVHKLFESFYAHYPQWKEIYERKIVYTYMTSMIITGNKWGAFSLQKDGSIYAHPGDESPTTADVDLSNYKKIVFKSTDTSCNKKDKIHIIIASPKGMINSLLIEKGATLNYNIIDGDGYYNIKISKVLNSGCDSLNIQFK